MSKERIKRYRKKPVVIEALKWDGVNLIGLREFMDNDKWRIVGREFPFDIEIDTLEGQHLARVGDYIIKGIKGEFYPCKPDIFGDTYEEVKSHES